MDGFQRDDASVIFGVSAQFAEIPRDCLPLPPLLRRRHCLRPAHCGIDDADQTRTLDPHHQIDDALHELHPRALLPRRAAQILVRPEAWRDRSAHQPVLRELRVEAIGIEVREVLDGNLDRLEAPLFRWPVARLARGCVSCELSVFIDGDT